MNKTTQNLEKRALALRQLILNTVDLYHQSEEGERALLETLVGAAIWYLPNLPELFNANISKAAYSSLKNNPLQTKLVEEHAIPRKVAGKLLYTFYLEDLKKDPNSIIKLYLEHFGRYNLVLKQENDRLKKYQKAHVFISEEEAYRNAGIDLMDFSLQEYQAFKKLKRYSSKSNDSVYEMG